MGLFREPQHGGTRGEPHPPRLHWTPGTHRGDANYAIVDRSGPIKTVAVDGCPVVLQAPDSFVVEALIDLRDGAKVVLLVAVRLDAPAARYRITDLVVRPADDAGVLDPDALKLVPMTTVLAESLIRVPHDVYVLGRAGRPGEPVDLEELAPNEYLAVLWLLAQLAGAEPNVFIADDLGITAQAAAQRVARARRAGLIPPASRPGARR